MGYSGLDGHTMPAWNAGPENRFETRTTFDPGTDIRR